MASTESTTKNISVSLDYPQHLRVFLQRMRDNEFLHDVVFIVENERFPTHRALVAAASPVFYNMLTNGMKETDQHEIVLKEVRADVWRKVLDYIYVGRIEVLDIDNAVQYLECASRFQMEELEKAIISYLEQMLDASNCCKILAVMDIFNFTALRKMALNTLVNNFFNVYCTSEFMELTYDLVVEILGCRELIVRSEFDVFLAAVYWIDSKMNPEIAKQACKTWKKYDLKIDSLEDANPNTGDMQNYIKLLDCVDLSNLSNADLRRVARFCRDLRNDVQTTWNVQQVNLQKFGEKVIENLLVPYNTIPNLPVLPDNRVPHGRHDILFAFSQRFDNVQNLINHSGMIDKPYDSPTFVDESQNLKWFLSVYFRGHGEAARDKFLSCFLCLKDENMSDEQEKEFSIQLYIEVCNRDSRAEPMVFSELHVNDEKFSVRSFKQCNGLGWQKLVPLSVLRGKNTIVVGVTVYSNSE